MNTNVPVTPLSLSLSQPDSAGSFLSFFCLRFFLVNINLSLTEENSSNRLESLMEGQNRM